MTGVVLGYIPSPSNGTFSLGPLTLHMYGVMLLLGIAACIWLTGRRWVSWGGDWDLVFRVALWGVIAGVVGARLYHDITSWNQDPTIHEHWWGFAAVWEGGLGVWGGIPLDVAWYTTFRTFEEVLRIDPSYYFLHMRVNFWVSLGLWILSVGFFIWWQFFHAPSGKPVQKPRPVPTGPRMSVPKSRVR